MRTAPGTGHRLVGGDQVSGRLPAVRALTARQPWAWATIYGGRTWRTGGGELPTGVLTVPCDHCLALDRLGIDQRPVRS